MFDLAELHLLPAVVTWSDKEAAESHKRNNEHLYVPLFALIWHLKLMI